jgi:hypothetical protein
MVKRRKSQNLRNIASDPSAIIVSSPTPDDWAALNAIPNKISPKPSFKGEVQQVMRERSMRNPTDPSGQELFLSKEFFDEIKKKMRASSLRNPNDGPSSKGEVGYTFRQPSKRILQPGD